jgi:ABC-type branched-subunit amino acid transport system substrate-binding protein
MVVHSALPDSLTAAVDAELRAAGVRHVAHGDAHPMSAAEAVAGDDRSISLIGPYRSASVAEAVEATAPVGLPLLAPVATAAAVTRDDEPGCEDPARHHGTILRLIARDTVVAAHIAADVRAAGQRAVVIAARHAYGRPARRAARSRRPSSGRGRSPSRCGHPLRARRRS